MTLIELMVVVVVIALLAAVALPGYRASVRKAHRAEAKAALTTCAQRLERYFTENRGYTNATVDPLCIADVPPSYELRLPAPEATTYTLSAVPRGGQSDDACGTFTLDQNGVRGVADASLSAAECW